MVVENAFHVEPQLYQATQNMVAIIVAFLQPVAKILTFAMTREFSGIRERRQNILGPVSRHCLLRGGEGVFENLLRWMPVGPQSHN